MIACGAGVILGGEVWPQDRQSLNMPRFLQSIPISGRKFQFAARMAAVSSMMIPCGAGGGNHEGQLGIGTVDDQDSPVEVTNGGSWIDVSSAQENSCGIKTDGSLWCWGSDSEGQLGDGGGAVSSLIPKIVPGGQTWKQVSASDGGHVCAIRSNDSLWCWGENIFGEVGDGTTTDRTTPVAVSGGGTWKSVSAGGWYTCGLKTDDTAWCWGADNFGQLGNGVSGSTTTPMAVSGGGTWKALTAGAYATTCGLRPDNTGFCWGIGTHGGNGDGTTSDRQTPTTISGGGLWQDITPGTFGTCGIRSGGKVYCWGSGNGSAMLGQGNPYGDDDYSQPHLVIGGGQWKDLDTGDDHVCGIKSDDTLWCWGTDGEGQLGNGAGSTTQYSPIQIGADTWKMIRPGAYHTCGIKSDDTLWCWGPDWDGELGNGGGSSNVPDAISGGGTWKYVSSGPVISCGIKSDDSLWCWGDNSEGTLGNGSNTSSNVPVAVSGGGTWKTVSVGNTVVCAIRPDDTAWCWGYGQGGALGDGNLTDSNIPVQVDGGSTWKQIAAGDYHVCGIKPDHTAWCWGEDYDGALGTGWTGIEGSPVAVDGGDTWLQISAGYAQTCANQV